MHNNAAITMWPLTKDKMVLGLHYLVNNGKKPS
jgi:hypothetical protein